jgi:hypothetical protein
MMYVECRIWRFRRVVGLPVLQSALALVGGE